MQKSRRSGSAQEYVLAAIEAGSGALRALEAARALSARGDDEEQRLEGGLARALERFRAALAELRSLERSSPASAGFVLPARSRERGVNRVDAAGTREGQTRVRRRTARGRRWA